MRRRHRVVAFVFLATILGCGCSGTRKEPEATGKSDTGIVVLTHEQLSNAKLTTAVLETRAGSDTLRLPGTLEVDPRQTWRVSPFVAGVAQEVGATAHSVVRSGQMLARLHSAELGEAQVEYLEATGSLRMADADRNRSLELRKDGVVSESQWLRVETEFKRAEGALAKAERRLELAGMTRPQIEALSVPERRLGELTLRSPADGVVLQSTVARGQSLAAGEEAFVIANLSALWVNIDIPVARLSEVAKGAHVTVRVSGRSEHWTGVLGSFGGNVVAANQTVSGRVVVRNSGGFLRPGMYGMVEVVGKPVQALMAPAAAVFTVGDQSYVFEQLDSTRFRAVTVAADSPLGDWIPVVGSRAGAIVVVAGLAELKSHWLYKGEAE